MISRMSSRLNESSYQSKFGSNHLASLEAMTKSSPNLRYT